jgi:poly(A) polymerase
MAEETASLAADDWQQEPNSYPSTDGDAPLVIPRPNHDISRKDIDSLALRVLYKLHNEGYQAFLVGGAVRDFLQGTIPKDFDIATDATPEQLRRLFRNSRIIGRRFRLVHVFYGPEYFEVATLRRCVSEVEADADDLDGPVMEDNAWGTVESDAYRRDFTINALYYDIDGFSIVDYCGGVADLRDGIIRAIGDPVLRFREDPVRMLRAIKFAARFGYQFAPETKAALISEGSWIAEANGHRLAEEFFRIIGQKNPHEGFRLLFETGLLRAMYPTYFEAIGGTGAEQIVDVLTFLQGEREAGRFLPMECLTALLFVPLLADIHTEDDTFTDCVARVEHEVRGLCDQMELPRRLSTAAVGLLRGILYLFFYAGDRRRRGRFVHNEEFDWAWRLADCCWRNDVAVHAVLEVWLDTRERLGDTFVDGWVGKPDRRDVFSFRGATGGGRRDVHRGDGPVARRRRRRR